MAHHSAAGQDVELTRESDREYLSQDFISSFSIGMAIAGWVWGGILIAHHLPRQPVFTTAQWYGALVLALGGIAGQRLRHERLSWAIGIVLAALGIGALLGVLATGDRLYLLGLPLMIIVAGILLNASMIGMIALLSLGAMRLAEGWILPATLSITPFYVIIIVALGVALLLSYYLHVALELSWVSRQHATRQMVEARQRRAELGRALKALDEEYGRLEHLNRELETTRREADEARRLKAEFAANVSHELRTPINLVVGFSEMMYAAPESYGEPLPPAYLGDVHAIYRSARHLQTLIDDILDLSQIDARRMALTREVVSLEEVVREAARVVDDLVERKGLELVVEIEPDVPPVYIDRTRIRQVLLNLISNAARFTERGHIRVACSLYGGLEHGRETPTPYGAPGISLPKGRYLAVSVTDTGIGIRQEDLYKVFEEFRQVDGSARRKYGGTGLGLAISKRFVELHGGWMWIESQYGVGSTFTFVLPVAVDARGRPELVATQARQAQLAQKTVLVIDSDPAVRRYFERYMRDRHVVGVPRVDEALVSIARYGPELVVITDGSAGDGLLGLQAAQPDLAEARITIVGCAIPSERRRALALGMAGYLVKPVNREQLWGALARLGVPLRTILAVEDDPDMMRLLGRMLASDTGEADLLMAYSLAEARHIMEGTIPDVILLDMALPDGSGHDLLDWVRQQRGMERVPVIVVTANTHLDETASDAATQLTMTRREGFSMHDLLTFSELVCDSFPSRYARVTAREAEEA